MSTYTDDVSNVIPEDWFDSQCLKLRGLLPYNISGLKPSSRCLYQLLLDQSMQNFVLTLNEPLSWWTGAGNKTGRMGRSGYYYLYSQPRAYSKLIPIPVPISNREIVLRSISVTNGKRGSSNGVTRNGNSSLGTFTSKILWTLLKTILVFYKQ